MKIVFITSEFPTEKQFDGGLASYVARMSLSLIASGHEVFVIVPATQTARLDYRGIQVQRTQSPATVAWFGGQVATFIFWWRLSRAIHKAFLQIHSQGKVDVVQTPSICHLFMGFPKGVRHLHRLSSYLPLARKALELPDTWLDRGLDYWEHRTIRRADHTFAPSKMIANAAGQKAECQVSVIESPFVAINLEHDHSVFEQHLKGKTYLLYFGALNARKGLLELIQAIPPVLQDHADLYFVCIGSDQGYRGRAIMSYLREAASTTVDRLIYLPRIQHPQLMPIIANSLAVVLPSRDDNFPNACLEAFQNERTVVGTRGASFDQLIEDGVNGFLCDSYDPPSLQATLQKVLALTDEERRQIGERAKSTLTRLAPERIVQQWLQIAKP